MLCISFLRKSAFLVKGEGAWITKSLPSPLTIPYPLRREKLLRYAQVKFGAVAPKMQIWHFQGAGLGE